MYISAALLDNCTKLLIRPSQSARKITSACHNTQYVRAGCTRVQSRFCEGLEVGTRRDAAQGMFRRVGRTHTGGGKTWWPTGCGIHQRRCSAYLLRDLVFFIVFRAHAYLEVRRGTGKGRKEERKREREKGDANGSLWEKLSIETIDEKGAASVSAPFARSASILGRGIIGRYLHLLYAEEPHAAHYRRALLNHAWRARPAIYKAART